MRHRLQPDIEALEWGLQYLRNKGTLGPLAPQPASLQGNIIVDPQNVTGVATVNGSNSATVQTAGGAFRGRVFRLYRDLAGAWGTASPVLTLQTTLTFASSHIDDSDPVVFAPVVADNAPVILQGTSRPVVTSGVAAGTVAMNRATGQLLNVGVGAGPAANEFWINKTRGSCAWSDALVAGTTFSLSAPFLAQVPGVSTLPTQSANTGNGDIIDVVTLTAINLVQFTPVLSTTSGPLPAIYRCTVFDPNGAGASTFAIGINVMVQECLVQRILCYTGESGFDTAVLNCNLQGGINGGSVSQASYFLIGGIFGAATNATAMNVIVDGDTILNGSLSLSGTGQNGAGFGLVFIATGQTLTLDGYATGFSNGYNGGAPIVWGGGALNVRGRTVYNTGQSAANTFLNSGGLQLNGLTTAFSANTAQPTVIQGNIALTPAHLDAAQGAAGFGGKAFNLFSGASLQSSDVL